MYWPNWLIVVMPDRRYRGYVAGIRQRQAPTFPAGYRPRWPIPVTVPAMEGVVEGWIIGMPPGRCRTSAPVLFVEQEYVVLLRGGKWMTHVEHSAVTLGWTKETTNDQQ